MKRKVLIAVTIILLVSLSAVFVQRGYIMRKYGRAEVESQVRKRSEELIKQFKNGRMLNAGDISEITAYYHLTSKYDEGLKNLEEISSKQDNYMIYYGFSSLYAGKAQRAKAQSDKDKFISKSYENLLKGFEKVPARPLAYLTRAKGYVLLGCSDMAIADLQKAINTAEKENTILLAEGVHVDKERFILAVEKEIDKIKEASSECMLKTSDSTKKRL